jgi:hypothetical protein
MGDAQEGEEMAFLKRGPTTSGTFRSIALLGRFKVGGNMFIISEVGYQHVFS